MIVLDACVALKWVFADEHGSEKALIYRNAHTSGENEVYVSQLFYFEIANALTTKGFLEPKEFIEAYQLIWNLDLLKYELDIVDSLNSMLLAKTLMISVYDASYIVLAQKLNTNFVTSDIKLFNKCFELDFVKLL